MFEDFKESCRLFFKSRLTVAAFVMVVLFSILIWRVFHLQIVNGQEYQDNYTLKIVKEKTLNSSRGNIYDRNGKLLAYNELAYSVTIEDNGTYSSTDKKNESLNAQIAQIIAALERNGDSIVNDFKISLEDNGEYKYNVSGSSWKRFLADVYGEISYDDLGYDSKRGYDTSKATEEQVMSYLMEDCYGISDEYDRSTAYQIAVVRFSMAQNAYQKYIATTIATNVSEETMAYINEHSAEFQGVEVINDTIRKYNNSVYFASILGYTGKISTEEYNRLSVGNDRYTLNDVVGKGGIEQYMDADLKGEKGYEKIYVDYMGKVLDVIERQEPTAGNDVYLSIDSDLQIAVYHLLEQEIASILYSNIDNSSSDIPIPINDVYFALINNNVIDCEQFEEEDASDTEKTVLQVFQNRWEAVKNSLQDDLTGDNARTFEQHSEEYQDYYTYIIKQLKADKVLVTANIDTADEVYQLWAQNKLSPQDYLSHAISENWIDITQFSVEEKYADSAEIYNALCSYIQEEITTDNEFCKIVYEYLIKTGEITGRQLCLILYDQGVLPYDAKEIAALENGSIASNTFLKQKIKNLDITPAQLALDPCSGSCVITNTDTGEILALVSYPGYDSNRLANTVDAAYFKSLQEDKSLPLYNYATQEGTAPGSTFKMLSSVAGLAENVITINETITDKGAYENISNHPKCWIYPSAHGSINVSEAIRHSCNYFFYEVGYRLSTNNYSTGYDAKLGIEKITKYASMFGLDETTGIEIEESKPIIANDYPVMAAIGQSNNQYTTVQLSRYVTAVANGGTVYNYTLLNRVEDSTGKVLKTFEPEVRNTVDVLEEHEWNAIHTGMRMVVQNTSEFADFPISAAGKTGTAQQNLKRPDHALFVGYAPYEDPEISIASRISFGYTSHNAADFCRNAFAYYFKVEEADELLSGQIEEASGQTEETAGQSDVSEEQIDASAGQTDDSNLPETIVAN